MRMRFTLRRDEINTQSAVYWALKIIYGGVTQIFLKPLAGAHVNNVSAAEAASIMREQLYASVCV
jgi:hypothetical protein